MSNAEWWQRGPIADVPSMLQPVAHILLQVVESVDGMVAPLTTAQWNARPANVASIAFHVRHITGVVDRLFAYARGDALTETQLTVMRAEGAAITTAEIPLAIAHLHARLHAAVDELRTINPATVGEWRGVGRALLPSTVIGCLVHAAEHAMRHVGQLSVTARIVAVD